MAQISFDVFDSITPLKEIWTGFDTEAYSRIHSGEMNRMEYSFYQTYPWNEFVERHYSRKLSAKTGITRIEYILVKQDDKAVAIMPLRINRLSKRVEMTSWRTAGINNVVSPLCGDAHRNIFETLARYIRSRYRGMKLRFFDMPVDTPFVKALASLDNAHYSERGSYHIPLKDFENFDDYYSSLNKKLRHNIKTRSNHFTHGDLTSELRVFTMDTPPSADYWKQIWHLFFLRKNVWRKRKVTILRKLVCSWETRKECSGGMKTESFSQLPQTILFVFEINGRPAAFAFLYLHEGYIVVPKLAIDTEQRAHAPGILMLKEIMRWCYDHGVKDFDLCRGEEPYKQQMGAISETICRITVPAH